MRQARFVCAQIVASPNKIVRGHTYGERMASHTEDLTLGGLPRGRRPGEVSAAHLAWRVKGIGERPEDVRGIVTVVGAPQRLGEVLGPGAGHG